MIYLYYLTLYYLVSGVCAQCNLPEDQIDKESVNNIDCSFIKNNDSISDYNSVSNDDDCVIKNNVIHEDPVSASSGEYFNYNPLDDNFSSLNSRKTLNEDLTSKYFNSIESLNHDLNHENPSVENNKKNISDDLTPKYSNKGTRFNDNPITKYPNTLDHKQMNNDYLNPNYQSTLKGNEISNDNLTPKYPSISNSKENVDDNFIPNNFTNTNSNENFNYDLKDRNIQNRTKLFNGKLSPKYISTPNSKENINGNLTSEYPNTPIVRKVSHSPTTKSPEIQNSNENLIRSPDHFMNSSPTVTSVQTTVSSSNDSSDVTVATATEYMEEFTKPIKQNISKTWMYQMETNSEESNETTSTLIDYPFSVSIQRKGAHYASGALLNKCWVISTAGEFYNVRDTLKLYRARLGSVDCKRGGNVVPFKRFEIHPYYIRGKPNFDIALLKLAFFVDFTDFIRPIAISTTMGKVLSAKFMTTYWPRILVKGSVLPKTAGERINQNSMRVSIQRLIPQQKCVKAMKHLHEDLNESSLCLKSVASHHSVCMPDAGAPVTAKDGLWGITSGWSSPMCPEHFVPTIFTRLSSPPVRSWLNTVLLNIV